MFNGVYAGLQQYQGSHHKSEKRSLTFVMGVENFAPKKSTLFEKKTKLQWKTSVKVTHQPQINVFRPCSPVI